MEAVAGIEWQAVASWVVVLFAIYAISMERLSRFWSWLIRQHEEIPAVAVAVVAFFEAVFPLDALALKLGTAVLVVGLACWYIAAVQRRKNEDANQRAATHAAQATHTDILTKLNKDREREFAERARVLIQTLLTFGGKYLAEMQQDQANLSRINGAMAFDFLQNQRYEVKTVVDGFAERGWVFDYGVDLDSPSNLKDLMLLVQWLQACLHRLPR
jgi:hypothetical protein